MTIKETLENLARGIGRTINKHKATALVLGLAGLISVTSLKENVHFGSLTLHNPQGNHYVWGIFPITRIEREARGNFYTFGLIAGVNEAGDNSTITGNMSGYGLIAGVNEAGDNSTITGNMSGYGLIGGGNTAGDNSTITGNMSGYGLIAGVNTAGDNSTITGNIDAKGLLVVSPKGTNIGSNSEIGLEGFVVKKKTE